jgi:hypothetical protein
VGSRRRNYSDFLVALDEKIWKYVEEDILLFAEERDLSQLSELNG